MGLQDLQTLMSDKQSIAAAAGTVVCTNAIDLGAAGTIPSGYQSRGTARHDIGASAKPPKLLMQITTTVTSGGSATVQFQLIQSDNADLSSPDVLQSTAAIAYATLVAGYQPRLELPAGITKRYLGVQYVIAVATTTAGNVTAGLVADKQTLNV